MEFNTRMFQNIRAPEIISPMEIQTKGMNLASLGMQQKKMAMDMQNSEKDQAQQDYLRQASLVGNAFESISGMSPQERSMAYPKVREDLLRSGIDPNKLPPEHDEGSYRMMLTRYQQSKEGMEKQLMQSQIAKNKADAEKDRADAKARGMKGGHIDPVTGEMVIGKKMLPSDKVLAVSEGQRLPTMLEDIRSTIQNNADTFGPVMGRINAANPYNEKAKTMDAQLRASSQAFGRFMEGGVLRKEDEDKYRKMFPSLSDTPEVAANKLTIVDRLLKQKQEADVNALSASGYDTAAFSNQTQPPAPPSVLSGKQTQEGVAYAGDKPKMSQEDKDAISWAQKNFKNPKAKEILKLHRML